MFTGLFRNRYALFFLFIASGFLILLPALINIKTQSIFEVPLALIFIILSLLAKKSKNADFRKLWEIFFSFFVFDLVILLSTLATTIAGQYSQILVPFVDFIMTVIPILILLRLAGIPLSSIYLRKGRLKQGLIVGFVCFVILLVGILIAFNFLLVPTVKGLTFAKMLTLMPTVLVLAFLNAPKEELLFRGLFLKKYEPILGKKLSIFAQAPLFVLFHYVPQYTSLGITFVVSFLAVVFVASLGWAYLMQKTDSIIGSSLSHAGADIGIYLPILLGILH